MEKTWIFLGEGRDREAVWWNGGGSWKRAAAEYKRPHIPAPDGKASDEMTPLHILYPCRITFFVPLCFTYWQENKALWLPENFEDLDTELRVYNPENTD